LDVHRAANNLMVINNDETADILKDVFEPVASMIYVRDAGFKILFDCPEGLVVRVDRLRLQQVILNLSRNAAKFLVEGFLKLRANVRNGSVHLYVEDSGPGIPQDKRQFLFSSRFQQSLDILAQGTGVGLVLCKQLVDLMGGNISLDESYRSGYKNAPGTSIVIDLNKPPDELDSATELGKDNWDEENTEGMSSVDQHYAQQPSITIPKGEFPVLVPPSVIDGIPQNLSLLFVDDDRILRKQGTRAIKMLSPEWRVHEAASGEACLQMTENDNFDIIFIDQVSLLRMIRGRCVTILLNLTLVTGVAVLFLTST